MINAASLLPKLLSATRADPELTEVAAKIAWTRAAGAGLRDHAVPFRLYRNTLIVAVADAIWQKQLRAMSAELLFRINRLLNRQVVEFIEFRVDPVTLSQARGKTTPGKSAPLTPSQLPIPAELISAAGAITDRDLRERFIRAAQNCIARRESRDMS